MDFKRKEGFRFIFDQPIEADYEIYINGQLASIETYHAKILDISPRGMKIFCGPEIRSYLKNSTLQIKVHFLLDVTHIHAIGDVVWSRPFGSAYQCGLNFSVQPDIDELITNELKLRRKKEVFARRVKS
ncbi:PilZ domain-containing protein [Lysinibacillus sp. BW-2-10]|uniref:PilZ domain-containing protein n=1 Tax=Lysinibacillus sp. BW-2-10 TaxID=2590030 RepID=UPI0011805F51|nr:PilZ domain-containing protein [Lysinibacillus sp. BW-2-10]TSI04295.1 PilZ domain-containing protein [Lysinibacillus sp. BW-2-10]